MKIFVSESGLFKGSKLTEAELDDNIISTKDTFVSIKSDIYDVSKCPQRMKLVHGCKNN